MLNTYQYVYVKFIGAMVMVVVCFRVRSGCRGRGGSRPPRERGVGWGGQKVSVATTNASSSNHACPDHTVIRLCENRMRTLGVSLAHDYRPGRGGVADAEGKRFN